MSQVIDIAEGGTSSPRSIYAEAPIVKGVAAVPVVPGSIDFRATVTMRFAIEGD